MNVVAKLFAAGRGEDEFFISKSSGQIVIVDVFNFERLIQPGGIECFSSNLAFSFLRGFCL